MTVRDGVILKPDNFNVGDRVMVCPPIFTPEAGLPGTVEGIDSDRCVTLYMVRMDKYPCNVRPFSPEDLYEECPEGAYHQLVDGICEKCFKSKEVK